MCSVFGGASVLELREKVLDRRNGLGLILLLQIQEDPQAILLLALDKGRYIVYHGLTVFLALRRNRLYMSNYVA